MSWRNAGAALAAILALGFADVHHARRAYAGEEGIGRVDALAGMAEAKRRQAVVPLSTGAPVQQDDTLRTGAESRLGVLLADETRISLGENAALTLDRFVYDGQGPGQAALAVVRGAFLVVGGAVERTPKSRFTVKTPVATIALRGTSVWGGRIDGAFGVFVAQGSVDVTTRSGHVRLGAGQGTTIGRDLRPATPTAWPREKVGRALAMVQAR